MLRYGLQRLRQIAPFHAPIFDQSRVSIWLPQFDLGFRFRGKNVNVRRVMIVWPYHKSKTANSKDRGHGKI
jgi:hypothetical protein